MMDSTRIIGVLIASCIFFCASSVFGEKIEITGKTMGPIVYLVVLPDADASVKKRLQSEIQAELDNINSLMSTYVQSSDVSRINKSQADQWVAVDPLTIRVLNRALEIGNQTNGAFDITIGPIVDLWQFGPNKNEQTVPTDEQLALARKSVGQDNLELRVQPPAIRKKNSDTRIDLSAIAKGFAVDRVSKLLTGQGIDDFMVEVGGEVFVSGNGPKGTWRIGIEKPVDSSRAIDRIVGLENSRAMATSGDYRNFRIVDGKRISHTMDPRNGQPVENSVATACVIAPDCMTADAMATAVMVLGVEEGMKLCEAQGFDLYVVQRQGGSSFESYQTEEFPFLNKETVQNGEPANSIWSTFAAAIAVFGLAIVGMAIGAIFSNKPIKGSCGGISASGTVDADSPCSMCTKPASECPEQQEQATT